EPDDKSQHETGHDAPRPNPEPAVEAIANAPEEDDGADEGVARGRNRPGLAHRLLQRPRRAFDRRLTVDLCHAQFCARAMPAVICRAAGARTRSLWLRPPRSADQY